MPEPTSSLTAYSSEPGREDFQTALANLIREYALDVEAGRPAEEIARGMDEFRMKAARTSREQRDD